MTAARSITAAVGNEAYIAAVGLAGASQGASQWVTLPANLPGRQARHYVTTDRILALSDFSGSVATSEQATLLALKLPTLSMLGLTRNHTNPVDPIFMVDRLGAGALFVVASQYRGIVANNAAMIALAGPTPAIGDWCQKTDDSGNIYQLTATPSSTIGNWTARTGANRPRKAWGAVANQAAMIALSSAQVGDWVTRTDLSAAAWMLMQAPYSTAANWVAYKNDAGVAATPAGIIIRNTANFHAENLARYEGILMYELIRHDEWRVS